MLLKTSKQYPAQKKPIVKRGQTTSNNGQVDKQVDKQADKQAKKPG